MAPIGARGKRLLAIALLVAATAASAQIQPGREFDRLNPPRPVATGDRIEVIEFFYYGCPICYETQPLLSRWLTTAPGYVAIRRVPALSSESWAPFARLFYALDALGEIGRLHWPIYDNFHFEGVRVDRPDVLVGLLLGGSVAFLFSSLAIRAVGRAAQQVVVEVRNQFRDHPGIMDFTEKPDYGAVVDICTKTSLRELTTPGLLAVLAPLIAGFFLGAEGLGAFLAGAILTGQLLAVMLSNSGGAWDNGKKFIEEGNYGGKGSDSHKAAVIGDTVGDPFKDTAGPALNPMIKVMNLVALLIAPLVVSQTDDIAVRVATVIISAAVLGTMIWVSKNRSSGLEDDLAKAKAGASAAAAG